MSPKLYTDMFSWKLASYGSIVRGNEDTSEDSIAEACSPIIAAEIARRWNSIRISEELFERLVHFQELLVSKESELLQLQAEKSGVSKVLDMAIEMEIGRIRETSRILQEQIDEVLK